MAASDFTIRISGVVSYSDDSHGSFEAVAIQGTNLGGVVAQHSNADSLDNFRQLFADDPTSVNATLDILTPSASPGGITVTPGTSTPDKTVSDFVMEVSGVATFDDNTKSVFGAQFVNGTVSLFPNETSTTWAQIAGDQSTAAARTFLTSVFDAVVGSTTITT